ncbi:multidrug effflux MFS transporter [Thermobifida halotolerans]|uniref:Multidrug effflux MFS transporter n=1 Tax=Thermobifida halotolerans TaxID=483545 RepID=A0AA97LYC6_9ACTN|nr:multidrug effflux MFS transporter [Thermobifida halotolerans]
MQLSLTLLRPRQSAAPAAARRPATDRAPGGRPRRSVALLVFVLGLLTATSSLATDLYLPAFPDIAADLRATEAQVQLTLTAIMVGLAAGQLVIGPLSDRWGRRVPLLVGVGVFTLSSLASAVAPSVEALSVLRLLQGLSGAAGAVISRAVVRDVFDGDDGARFFSRLSMLTGLAPMLAPMLGSQLLLLGSWRLLFGVLALIGLVNLALVHFALPETRPRERRVERAGGRRGSVANVLLRLQLDPRFMGPTLVMALSFAMTFTYISAFSFVSESEFGATPQQFGVIFGVNSLSMVVGNQVNAMLIGRVDGPRRLLAGLLGALVSVAALVCLAVSGQAGLVSVTAALIAMMFFTGLISPNATTLAIAGQPASVAGTGSALLGALQFAIGGGLAATTGMGEGGEASLLSMSTVMLATAAAATAVFVGWAVHAHRSAAPRTA